MKQGGYPYKREEGLQEILFIREGEGQRSERRKSSKENQYRVAEARSFDTYSLCGSPRIQWATYVFILQLYLSMQNE